MSEGSQGIKHNPVEVLSFLWSSSSKKRENGSESPLIKYEGDGYCNSNAVGEGKKLPSPFELTEWVLNLREAI